jgi:hypothetical protein
MKDRTSGRFGFGSRVREPPRFSLSGLTGCGSRATRSELLGSTDRRLWLCRRRPSTTHRVPDLWAVGFPPASSGLPLTDSLSPDLSVSLSDSQHLSPILTLSSLNLSHLSSQSHSLSRCLCFWATEQRRNKEGRKKNRRKRRVKNKCGPVIIKERYYFSVIIVLVKYQIFYA